MDVHGIDPESPMPQQKFSNIPKRSLQAKSYSFGNRYIGPSG